MKKIGTTHECIQRIFEIAGATKQEELAAFLDISQPVVSTVKSSRKFGVPDSWLIRCFDMGYNPDWVRYGTGNKYHSLKN